MASTQNRDRAGPEPAMEIWYADRSPTARSTARQCRSISAMSTCWRAVAASSWATPLDELLAKRMPDVLEQFGVMRRLPHLHRVARPRKIHIDHVLHPPRTRPDHDDAFAY